MVGEEEAFSFLPYLSRPMLWASTARRATTETRTAMLWLCCVVCVVCVCGLGEARYASSSNVSTNGSLDLLSFVPKPAFRQPKRRGERPFSLVQQPMYNKKRKLSCAAFLVC